VLAIGLDGFELSYADRMIASGDLPALGALRDASARYLLDHGSAQRTGLAWEHLISGLTPSESGRAAAIEFDAAGYDVWQEGARFEPFIGRLAARTVVFDANYCDLRRAPSVVGVTGWGAHDPGLSGTETSPPDLLADLEAHEGMYPAKRWTYAAPWPSAETTRAMGAGLVDALAVRTRAARWLLTQRFGDWDLALVVAGEPHSAAEALWHGVEAEHPLHGHPSAAPAAAALAATYRQADRMVGELVEATNPSTVIAFSMGGMGSNESDAPSMALLPELLLRWSLGERLLEVPETWAQQPHEVPILAEDASWDEAARTWRRQRGDQRSMVRQLARHLPPGARRALAGIRKTGASTRPLGYLRLDWQPATWYRPWWRRMRAFALPAFYDGRIRVNLQGRERHGIVDPADYERVGDELEDLVRSCIDPRTGKSVVKEFERPGAHDPMALRSSESDAVVVWSGSICALEHPTLGLVGPVPFRRTGGHTGPYGFAFISGPGIAAADHGVRSAFDVAPTLVDLLGEGPLDDVAGTSLLAAPEPVATGQTAATRSARHNSLH
jgi:predicted AlkP superfamily phosphohydrolase/phosphomutase